MFDEKGEKMKKILLGFVLLLVVMIFSSEQTHVHASSIGEITPYVVEICPEHGVKHRMEEKGSIAFWNSSPPQPMKLYRCDCGLEMALSGNPEIGGAIGYYLLDHEFSIKYTVDIDNVYVFRSDTYVSIWHYTSSSTWAGSDFYNL